MTTSEILRGKPLGALLVMMMLSACGGSETRETLTPPAIVRVVKVAIPDLSAADKKACYRPDIIGGVDGRAALADVLVALGACSQKHRRVVRQYSDAQKL